MNPVSCHEVLSLTCSSVYNLDEHYSSIVKEDMISLCYSTLISDYILLQFGSIERSYTMRGYLGQKSGETFARLTRLTRGKPPECQSSRRDSVPE